MKLLIDEVGSEDAERLWNDPAPAAASRLAVPEVGAALAAARRGGRLDQAAYGTALREWHSYQSEIDLIELTPELARHAADLAVTYPLSGADAVHLATALALVDSGVVIATWDHRLADAVLAEGLPVIPGDF